MKRLRPVLLSALLVLTVLTAFAGCAPKYTFAKSAEPIDIFQEMERAGSVSGFWLTVRPDGSGELKAEFSVPDVDVYAVAKEINERALSEKRYAAGERVFDVTYAKTQGGKLTAVLAFASAAHFNNPEFDVLPLYYYLERNAAAASATEFFDAKRAAVELKALDPEASVLVLSGHAGNVPVKVNGKILAASGASSDPRKGFVAYDGGSVTSVGDDLTVVFRRSDTLMIVLIVVGAAAVLAVVFLLLVKFRVFTALKVKSAKRK